RQSGRGPVSWIHNGRNMLTPIFSAARTPPPLRGGVNWSLTLLLLPFTLIAQTTGTIAGRVSAANGTPVAGAFVLLDAGSRPLAQTDADGRYRIGGVSPGTHIVVVRASGFAASTKTIDVGRDGATADFTVSPTAATLSAVTVIGTRSDLAETRERVFQVAG